MSSRFQPCPPNPRDPISFETEFFKGQAMLLIRTEPLDPPFLPFFSGNPKADNAFRRTFEVQVQGKFKRDPIGEIFVGAEATNKMELGMITRSICQAAMKFCGTMVNDLHHSFGDDQSKKDFQIPHVVAPLFPTLDKIVVTPAGEPPPPLGVPFPEDPEFRKKRMKFRYIADSGMDINTTFSFSVNTAQLDVAAWQLTNIPMVRPMDLQTFFGDSSIRLVAYEIPRVVLQGNPAIHPQEKLNYAFNIKLTRRVGSDDPYPDFDLQVEGEPMKELEADADEEEEVEEDDDEDQSGFGAPSQQTTAPLPNPLSEEEYSDREEDEDLEGEGDGEIDGEGDPDGHHEDFENDIDDGKSETKKSSFGLLKKQTIFGREDGGVRATMNWLRRRMGDTIHEGMDSEDFDLPDHDSEIEGDLQFCPACIEVNDRRIIDGRNKRYLYAIPARQDPSIPDSGGVIRIRAFSDISRALSMQPAPRLSKAKKFSVEEKKRREIVESYRHLVSRGSPSQIGIFQSLLSQETDQDRNFLSASAVNARPKSTNRFEGSVAVAKSNRHWSEKHLILTRTEIAIVDHFGSKNISITFPLSAVLGVRVLRVDEAPMTQFGFFQVETFNRVYYFMVRNDGQAQDWVTAFTSILDEAGPTALDKRASEVAPTYLNEREDMYLARPWGWKLDKRRVFNFRRIFFRSAQHLTNTCEIVESILSKAFDLSTQDDSTTFSTHQLWIDFFDELSALQILDISILSDPERISVLLNIYHIMIIHCSIVLGPPPAWNLWQSYFNTVSYIIGADLISIAELEHNILRASMSNPKFVSKLLAPQTHFPSLALKQRDFRLNFCINNGSFSMPEHVPVYRASTLDQQLDEMTMLMLNQCVEVQFSRRLVILPKFCSSSSCLQDFAPRNATSFTPFDCLRVLCSYLQGETRMGMMKLIMDPTCNASNVTIKYKKVSSRCRKLKQLKLD